MIRANYEKAAGPKELVISTGSRTHSSYSRQTRENGSYGHARLRACSIHFSGKRTNQS
jgi:hypothetical protein